MSQMKLIVWLFPILFMFHDFEEIIFLEAWIRKNSLYLSEKFPTLYIRISPFLNNIRISSFSLGVAEEFLLISTATIYSFISGFYLLWVGLFIAFTIHLLIHCIQAVIIRKYVPAITTSIICLPICLYIILQLLQLFQVEVILFYSVISIIAMVINLVFVHKVMKIFTHWLSLYENTKNEIL